MENKFEKIIENLEEEEILTLGDQTFLNEMILDKSIQCSILGTLTFFGKPDNVLNCSYDSPLKTSHQGNPVTLCDDYLYDFESDFVNLLKSYQMICFCDSRHSDEKSISLFGLNLEHTRQTLKYPNRILKFL